MANHNNEEFVNKRLGGMGEPQGFAPNAAQARILLEVRQSAGRQRWVWKAAMAAAMLVVFVVLPAVKAVAQTGTLSPEAFLHSLHGMLRGAHDHLYWALRHWLHS